MRKLSEITGEEAMRVTAEIIKTGREVTKDEELRKYLGKRPSEINRSDWNIDMANRFFTLMLTDYQEQAVELLAMIAGESVEDYKAKLTVENIYTDLYSLMSESTFITLFFASAPRGKIRSGS